MKILIVHAHPETLSMNSTLTAVAVDTLRAHGHEVEVSDLYRQGFQAVASSADFTRPVHPARLGYVHEQRHATAYRGYARDILEEQDKVARADLVIFQFPLWWYAVPAILKGWADRVLTHGFAYTDERSFASGLLAGKHAMLSLTTGGTARELHADRRYTGSVEEFLRPFSGGVLAYTGMNVLPSFIAYAPASRGDEGRRAQLADYRRHLERYALAPALRRGTVRHTRGSELVASLRPPNH
jgi:NAD(P)H dehydrogenase (quinone)